MDAEIGRIISLTQIGESALPLYIQTARKKLEAPEYDPKNKFSLKLSSPNYTVKSDFVESIEAAVECSEYFMKLYFPHLYQEFSFSHFSIDIGCGGINRPLAIRGKSCGLGISLSILSSILGFRIKEDVAVTGKVERDGRILFVMSLKEKLDRFLKDNSFSAFLAPYVALRHEDVIKELYQYLAENEDYLEKEKKFVFLCSSLLESLVFATSKNSFESILIECMHEDCDKIYKDLKDCLETIHDDVTFQKTKRIFPSVVIGSKVIDEIRDKNNRFMEYQEVVILKTTQRQAGPERNDFWEHVIKERAKHFGLKLKYI